MLDLEREYETDRQTVTNAVLPGFTKIWTADEIIRLLKELPPAPKPFPWEVPLTLSYTPPLPEAPGGVTIYWTDSRGRLWAGGKLVSTR